MTNAPTVKEAQDRLSALYLEHSEDLVRFLRGFTRGDRDAADDLLQEAMVRAWRRRDALPEQGESARRWLFVVARNVAIDALRMRKVRPAEALLPDPAMLPASEDTSEAVVAGMSLRQAFRSLTAAHRVILSELYLRGSSVEETACRLGVPAGTVKSRAHYALRSLRRAITCPA